MLYVKPGDRDSMTVPPADEGVVSEEAYPQNVGPTKLPTDVSYAYTENTVGAVASGSSENVALYESK